MIPYLLFFASLAAFGFFVYSLLNLKKLGITVTHPRLIVEFGLFATFLIAGLFFGSGSGISIPPTTGPYCVGTARYVFTDYDRPETFTSDEADYREVAVKIWYPAEKLSCKNRAPYIEYARERKRTLPERSPLPPRFFAKVAPVKSNSFYDAAISETQEHYPIILFSHAYGAGINANSILLEELASHGYISVSIGHAYETSHFITEEGSIKVFDPANPELLLRAAERQNTFELQRQINDTAENEELSSIIAQLMAARPKTMESLAIWTADIAFIIDKLHELDRSPGLLFRKLDLGKIGVVGHSFGGAAAGQACLVDQRCKAGVNLDGLQIGGMLEKPLDRPFMFMHHDNKNARNKKPNKVFYAQANSAAYLLLIEGTSHFNFSDLSMPFYSELLASPPGFIGSIDGYRALIILNVYVRAFFDKHLRDRNVALLDGPSPDYPEVEISVKK